MNLSTIDIILISVLPISFVLFFIGIYSRLASERLYAKLSGDTKTTS